MVYDAARKLDRGERITLESSMIKVFTSEMACRVADKALQIHGASRFIVRFVCVRSRSAAFSAGSGDIGIRIVRIDRFIHAVAVHVYWSTLATGRWDIRI